MARQPKDPLNPIVELDSYTDRLANWAAANPALVVAILVTILGVATATGVYTAWHAKRLDTASATLAAVQSEYLEAMGASPDALDMPEPANPETAKRVRSQYVERFQEVAQETRGTPASALALVEAGNVQEAAGDREAAITSWEAALGTLENQPLRGLVLQRIAAAHEEAGRWQQAAESYARAAELPDFPLRHRAMTEAARCFAQAGDSARALDLWVRLRAEAPGLVVPPHTAARLGELAALADARSAPPAP